MSRRPGGDCPPVGLVRRQYIRLPLGQQRIGPQIALQLPLLREYHGFRTYLRLKVKRRFLTFPRLGQTLPSSPQLLPKPFVDGLVPARGRPMLRQTQIGFPRHLRHLFRRLPRRLGLQEGPFARRRPRVPI